MALHHLKMIVLESLNFCLYIEQKRCILVGISVLNYTKSSKKCTPTQESSQKSISFGSAEKYLSKTSINFQNSVLRDFF